MVVGEAADGREAIDMTSDLRPDVVMMDVSMPLMSGDQATRLIKRHVPRTRVIALSMYDEADKKERMYQAGGKLCAQDRLRRRDSRRHPRQRDWLIAIEKLEGRHSQSCRCRSVVGAGTLGAVGIMPQGHRLRLGKAGNGPVCSRILMDRMAARFRRSQALARPP